MLVLTCDVRECIRINNDIKIHILDIGSRNIKLGIEAPRNIRINRKEIYDAIKAKEID